MKEISLKTDAKENINSEFSEGSNNSFIFSLAKKIWNLNLIIQPKRNTDGMQLSGNNEGQPTCILC